MLRSLPQICIQNKCAKHKKILGSMCLYDLAVRETFALMCSYKEKNEPQNYKTLHKISIHASAQSTLLWSYDCPAVNERAKKKRTGKKRWQQLSLSLFSFSSVCSILQFFATAKIWFLVVAVPSLSLLLLLLLLCIHFMNINYGEMNYYLVDHFYTIANLYDLCEYLMWIHCTHSPSNLYTLPMKEFCFLASIVLVRIVWMPDAHANQASILIGEEVKHRKKTKLKIKYSHIGRAYRAVCVARLERMLNKLCIYSECEK